MNGANHHPPTNASTRLPKPPPAGPAPPPPASAPPNPPAAARTQPPHSHVNGQQPQKGKKKNDIPMDPATMYESLKNRIAALEEDQVMGEEEERQFGTPLHSYTHSRFLNFLSGRGPEIGQRHDRDRNSCQIHRIGTDFSGYSIHFPTSSYSLPS